MKQVYIMGFLGTGIRNSFYETEHELIKLGHVGVCFEGEEFLIFGFHPSPESISAIGGKDFALSWLRNRKDQNRLDGILQDDTAIFERAYMISQLNPQVTVWQKIQLLEEYSFVSVRSKCYEWYNQKTIFPYALPLRSREIEWDNCATFLRQLGLALPESTGQLQRFIPALQEGGTRWNPKGDK